METVQALKEKYALITGTVINVDARWSARA